LGAAGPLMGKSEYRDPKSEIRNKSEYRKRKSRNRNLRVPFRDFLFGIGICFGFRISIFGFPISTSPSLEQRQEPPRVACRPGWNRPCAGRSAPPVAPGRPPRAAAAPRRGGPARAGGLRGVRRRAGPPRAAAAVPPRR